MFVDEAKIRVASGAGGNGCMAFRREKFVPRGGPSGGDGGRGGDVIMEASERHNTLVHFRFNPEYKAQRGRHGEGSNRTGPRRQEHHAEGSGWHRWFTTTRPASWCTILRAEREHCDRQRRTRRTRQPALRHSDAPGSARARSRASGRRAAAAAGAEAAGRCGTGRLSRTPASPR